jgi:hypothetical protein
VTVVDPACGSRASRWAFSTPTSGAATRCSGCSTSTPSGTASPAPHTSRWPAITKKPHGISPNAIRPSARAKAISILPLATGGCRRRRHSRMQHGHSAPRRRSEAAAFRNRADKPKIVGLADRRRPLHRRFPDAEDRRRARQSQHSDDPDHRACLGRAGCPNGLRPASGQTRNGDKETFDLEILISYVGTLVEFLVRCADYLVSLADDDEVDTTQIGRRFLRSQFAGFVGPPDRQPQKLS